MKKTRSVDIRLSYDQVSDLNRISKDMGLSRSELIRLSIDKMIKGIDDNLELMKSLTLSKDINEFCKKKCPFDKCLATKKDPLRCWCIQRKFDI